jgi:diguanylate cyclase (GGDEF)-like protein
MSSVAQVSKRGSVLVGSADTAFREQVRSALEGAGHLVLMAGSPGELHLALHEAPPDMVLLAFADMDADGFELCRDLTARGGTDAPPVLVAGDGNDAECVDRAYRAGAADFVPLPVRWPLLLHQVRRLLEADEISSAPERDLASLANLERIAGLGSWSWNVATGRMHWSDQTFQLLGMAPGEVKPDFERFAACMHPEDRQAAVDLMEGAARAGRPFEAPIRLQCPDDSVRHVQVRGETVPDGNPEVQGTIQDVSEQRRAQEKIRQLAHYDALTGLANRRRFMEQIEEARATAQDGGHPMALLYLDLDQFKRINDTLGHTAGDGILQAVADVLYEKVRRTDLVGRGSTAGSSEISRLGGDEFAVLLTKITSREDAGLVAGRILSALPAPLLVDEHQISTTASIGIAIYPEDGDDVESLVKHADRAMYHAKERGRNNYQFYAQSLDAGALKKLTMESELRTAVEREELQLLYQPRIDVGTGRVLGAEALLRWNHPELGRIPPKQFIPLAEETGLIIPIGTWVLDTACHQLRRWLDAGVRDLTMSVNVSTVQFREEDLVSTVAQSLEGAGLDPGCLELEITESLMLQDDETTARILRDLRAMGLRIALDDFGTGYSSLSYLARFPLDSLKLDMSCVRDVASDPNARAIATAMISMARGLGLRVVAEGVDHEAQLRFLRAKGCDEMQGFLVSGAIGPEEFVSFRTACENAANA